MSKNAIIKMLQEIRFLRDIDPRHLEQLAQLADSCDFETAEVVFREGQAADDVYLVASGKLSLELSPSTIFRKHLVDVGPGEMLGWSSLTEQQQFVATAVALEPTRLIRIDGVRLRALCDSDPKFGYEIVRRAMKSLAKRLTVTWKQLLKLYVSQFAPLSVPSDE